MTIIDLTIDKSRRKNAIRRAKERKIIIPTYAQMKDPSKIPAKIKEDLKAVGLWDVDPRHLFRITWHNEAKASGGSVDTYPALCHYMDDQITIAVLGESATTKGGGGQAASAAITRNEVRLELVQADADLLSATLNGTIVKWITEFNVPGATPPRVWRKVEEQKDLGAVATRDKTIFDMGFEPSEAYINETYGGEWTKRKISQTISPDKASGLTANHAGSCSPILSTFRARSARPRAVRVRPSE